MLEMHESKIKHTDIKEFYKFEKHLGEGSFGIVRKAIRKANNEEYAIKCLEKSKMDMEDLYALSAEVEILSQIDHPNVVKLFEVYEDSAKFYMVFELMTGGELFERIVEKEHYSEKEAADTIRPIIDAIRYCHSMGIAHRDLKPENLLYATKDPSSIIKISDFGLARGFENDLMTTQCGTPTYIAPEIIQGKGYDKKVDYWSIGVIIYTMLCGYPPFYDEDNDKLFEMIQKGKVEFAKEYWDEVSDMAKDVIVRLLQPDPNKRISCEELLKHPWIIGDVTPRKQLLSTTRKIKEFNAKKRELEP
jgi:calcium/calmodulin-dependent protein kinase I